MAISQSAALQRLQELLHKCDSQSLNHKCHSLQALLTGSLRTREDVARLHEILCFMRAYPDTDIVLHKVEALLSNFTDRNDLKRHQRALADTGIAGTTIHFPFYWQTARWLYERWPEAISIHWARWQQRDALEEMWPLLLSEPALEAQEGMAFSAQTLIDTLKQSQETDASFLIQLFLRWKVEESVREKFYDDLDVPLILTPGKGTPSRTLSKYPPVRVFYTRQNPAPATTIAEALQQRPRSSRTVSMAEGKRLIDLARIQMVTRERDLYAFMNAYSRDVQILNYKGGLQFVSYGLIPERRSVLEAMYVFLILKNGVPIGYTQATALLGSAEINFNIFESFRGTETSQIFINTLSMVRHLFKSDAFIINTQQLGEDNPEAIKSGAFWFYHKHGFRPRDTNTLRILRSEVARRKTRPGYRSSISTLKLLAGSDIYLFLDTPRSDLVSTLATENIALRSAKVLEQHAGKSCPNGIRHCVEQAMHLLAYRPRKRLSRSCKTAWERWSPIIVTIPSLSRWSSTNKRALIKIINAKGGQRESKYVSLFDQHRLLQSAILKLSKKSAG